jgi:GT2 family glycosyltransferase
MLSLRPKLIQGGGEGSHPQLRPTIAALITCHNRRQQTLDCIGALLAQQIDNAALTIYLVDDGSSDGSGDSVQRSYPQVTVIRGTGTLFWGGGMRLAYETAIQGAFDFHLWLNDDVVLAPGSLAHLVATYDGLRKKSTSSMVVVGALASPTSGETTYSGWLRSRLHPLRFEHVEPTGCPQLCDTMNGNVVLIPRSVYSSLGGPDKAFPHGLGDFDYGLRVTQTHGQVWLAAGYVGTCSKGDPNRFLSRSPRKSALGRLRDVTAAKALPPLAWMAFAHRHGGPLWPALWVSPYLKAVAGRVAGRP